MANNDIIVSEMTPASQINTGDLMIMTQPDAQSETGYSTKSGTVLQVSNKMLKGTNYETDLPSFTNKNVLGGMEELKGDIFNLLPVDEASGSIANFETELAAPLQSVLADVVASQPSGTPTPSTPLPITGYSSANITRCGVNLWEFDNTCIGKNYDGYANVKRYSQTIKMPLTTYTFCRKGSFANFSDVYVGISKKPIGNTLNLNSDTQRYSISSDTYKTVTTTAEYPYLFILAITNQEEMTETIMNELQLMISVGSSVPTAYLPYNGQTLTVAFGQTVYGGVLDVTRGKLTVTWVSLDLSSLSYVYEAYADTRHRFRASMPSNYRKPATVDQRYDFICEVFSINNSPISSSTDIDNSLCGYTNDQQIYIRCDSYTDVASFTTAMLGKSLVYPLSTPFDIDLTPEVISAIVGENNVFAGCGGVDVKFKDTIQHYIDKKIAQTQALIL